ncbi:MAG: TMEM43 family protein [Deltaproteobacteria bacterium]|nr:TMEM43 family protein [Deltaproteobacteria bacterium]
MGEDSFSEVTNISWFSRIKESIKGVLFGIILFIVAFPVLFWNEGRAVHTAKGLEEGQAQVATVSADVVAPENQGKVIHLVGRADTKEALSDPVFGLSKTALRFNRTVEMFQWKESSETKSKKELGGGETRETTYSYSTEWNEGLIDSRQFKHPADHVNPAQMEVSSTGQNARNPTLGGFQLGQGGVSELNNFKPVALSDADLAKVSGRYKGKLKVTESHFYTGDPNTPKVGDLRISFKEVAPGPVSVVAQQNGQGFVPFSTSQGTTIFMVEPGEHSSGEMFSSAFRANTITTWLIRIGGWLLMSLGLFMVVNPIKVLADVVPFLGTLVSFGLGLVTGIIALVLSLITIAAGWIVYRPVLGSLLLLLAVGVAGGFYYMAKQKKAKAATPAPAA